MNAFSSTSLLSNGGRPSFRAVFISDVHLGTKDCRSDFLADFLKQSTCEHLYLVGDIVDGWRLRKSWYWDASHDDVIRLILKKARSGTAVTYIPGNHDEMFRAWLPMGLEVAGVKLRQDAEHVTADGRRLLVLHGDEFDSVVRYAKFLALLGDRAYTVALVANRYFNAVRRRLGHPYWSLSAWLEAPGEGGGEGDRPLRAGRRQRSPPARLRRRGVRPHPSRRNARGRRRAVPQRRATGWKAAPPWSNTRMAGWN